MILNEDIQNLLELLVIKKSEESNTLQLGGIIVQIVIAIVPFLIIYYSIRKEKNAKKDKIIDISKIIHAELKSQLEQVNILANSIIERNPQAEEVREIIRIESKTFMPYLASTSFREFEILPKECVESLITYYYCANLSYETSQSNYLKDKDIKKTLMNSIYTQLRIGYKALADLQLHIYKNKSEYDKYVELSKNFSKKSKECLSKE